jgi:hypothetical protein
MQAQSKLAVEYGNQANLAEAQRRDVMNKTLERYGKAPIYEPYKTATGEVIDPNVAFTPIDPSGLIDPSMWKVPRTVGGNKKEEPKTEKEKYLAAVNTKKQSMPRMTGGG